MFAFDRKAQHRAQPKPPAPSRRSSDFDVAPRIPTVQGRAGSAPAAVQRKSTGRGEESVVQTGRAAPASADSLPGASAPDSIPNDAGEPLPGALQSRFERSFGHDLSSVRVHHDAQASEAAARQQALAFTFGQHIFFGRGQYLPGQDDGQRLIAHELVHTIQQRDSAPPLSNRSEWAFGKTGDSYRWSRSTSTGGPADVLEREADTLAAQHSGAARKGDIAQVPVRTQKAAQQGIARARVPLPSPMPLCGKTLTDIEINPPRALPLEPCLPASVLVTRINIVGRDATSPSATNQVFNLHLGYYVDPTTGQYCAIADDSKSCIAGRCVFLGCFPTLQEVVDALMEFAKKALIALGVVLLALLIAEILAAIGPILAGAAALASADTGGQAGGSKAPTPPDESAPSPPAQASV
jgi:hypothetical protein